MGFAPSGPKYLTIRSTAIFFRSSIGRPLHCRARRPSIKPTRNPGLLSGGLASDRNELGGVSVNSRPFMPCSRQKGFSYATQYLITEPIGICSVSASRPGGSGGWERMREEGGQGEGHLCLV